MGNTNLVSDFSGGVFIFAEVTERGSHFVFFPPLARYYTPSQANYVTWIFIDMHLNNSAVYYRVQVVNKSEAFVNPVQSTVFFPTFFRADNINSTQIRRCISLKPRAADKSCCRDYLIIPLTWVVWHGDALFTVISRNSKAVSNFDGCRAAICCVFSDNAALHVLSDSLQLLSNDTKRHETRRMRRSSELMKRPLWICMRVQIQSNADVFQANYLGSCRWSSTKMSDDVKTRRWS